MATETNGAYTWGLITGDDSVRQFTWLDDEDTPINVTGYTGTFTYDVGEVAGTLAAVVDGPAGTFTVTIPDSLTALFLGNGRFRLQVASPGDLKSTLAWGTLQVVKVP